MLKKLLVVIIFIVVISISLFVVVIPLANNYYAVNSSKRGHMLRTNGALSPF